MCEREAEKYMRRERERACVREGESVCERGRAQITRKDKSGEAELARAPRHHNPDLNAHEPRLLFWTLILIKDVFTVRESSGGWDRAWSVCAFVSMLGMSIQ